MSTAAKVVIVTGANSGLGYEAVKALLESTRPSHIFVGARTSEKAEAAITSLRGECATTTSTMEPLEVDLDSDASITRAYEHVAAGPGRVDALVNNAAAAYDPMYLRGEMTLRECFMRAYSANVAGTHVLTHTLMPLLLRSADPRLIFVTGLSQITKAAEKYTPTPDLPKGWPKTLAFDTIGYRCSKNALNMLMLDWNHKLKADGVKVWALAPGMLATNLGGVGPKAVEAMGGKHPSVGGGLIRSVVEGERDADTGKIVSRDGLTPW